MKNSVLKSKLIILLLFLSVSLFAAKKEMIVIIDPGHGGKDAGAVHGAIREKDIVLNIGLKLGKQITEQFPDVKVIYTRNSDVFVPLHQRAAIANQHKADLFISLHANHCGAPSIVGTETFILGLHRSQDNLEVAKKENAVILFEEDHSERYEGFDPNSSESYIMFELIQDEFLEQSAQFANHVQKQFTNAAGRKNRGVKQAGFLVLRQTGMPSVLIEAGFLSNQTEAKYLDSKSGQENIAAAIFSAFKDYKKAVDSKSEFSIPERMATNEKPTPQSQGKPATPVKTVPDNVFFSIQLAASQKEIKTTPANFKGLNGVRSNKVGNVYKYCIGKETSIEKVELLKNEVRKKYPDSFVVAFRNNQQITIKEATKLLEDK